MSALALVFISPVLFFSFVLCESNMRKKKKKVTWRIHLPENSLYYWSVTYLALCKKKVSSSWFESIWNQMRGWNRQIKPERNNTAIAEAYSHTGLKITLLIIQLQARESTVSLQPLRTQHRVFQCVFTKTEPSDEREGRSTQGWESSRWMHEWLITFLTSWTSTLYKRRALARAWRGQTRSEGFPK